MKTFLMLTHVVFGSALGAIGQGVDGVFLFRNGPDARTRISSIEGPFAGLDIYAHALVGPTLDALIPVGPSTRHLPQTPPGGLLIPIEITVPGYGVGAELFVQMVAWDSRLWGTAFESVPPDQFGHTDIRHVELSDSPNVGGVPIPPFFMQSAIVPVPEPSVLVLSVLAGAMLVFRRNRLPRMLARPIVRYRTGDLVRLQHDFSVLAVVGALD